MEDTNPREHAYDVIVVGGGIAGLTSATYLARAGRSVLLLEQNQDCGGLVSSFSRDGYHFEAGVRALEDAGVIFPMLRDLGIHLEVVRSHVSVGVEDEILRVQDMQSLQAYRDMLVKLYPASREDIDRVVDAIRTVMRHMDVLYGVENPAFKDLRRDRAYIFRKLLPWLPRFLFTVRRINSMYLPVEHYLEGLVHDRSLRDIISQHFFLNTPTFFALSYFSLYLDYFYPKGGVGTLAEVLEEKLRELGGRVQTGTRVVGVHAAERVVTDADGGRYRYGHLVWAADLNALYAATDTAGLSRKAVLAIGDVRRSMEGKRGADSVFSLFLQIDAPPERFGSIATGHFFYTPSRDGLGDTHRAELKDLLQREGPLDKTDVFAWLTRFTGKNTYEISIPALKYAELAPPGKTGMIVSLLADYDLFSRVREEGWYEEFVAELERQMLQVLSESVYPGLQEQVIASFSFSPLSIERRVGSTDGAIIGWSFGDAVPAAHRIQDAGRAVITPIPHVVQAGQWAYSPGGVPMSILTGKLAADRVLKQRATPSA
jgi:phytoene dehydrogenase-like protein